MGEFSKLPPPHAQNLTPPRKTNLARQLRKHQTPAEKQLWELLRHHQMEGFHFRRQHPVEGYIADFACVRAKLIIELDGSAHNDTAEYDANRDEVLENRGWTILRFSNSELQLAPQEVWERIASLLK